MNKNKVEKYIITSVTNNTRIFKEALVSLESYASYLNATLIVMPVHYNYDGISDIIYDNDVKQYMIDKDVIIKDTVLLGSFKLRPTLIKPLSGLGTLYGESNIIVASPKLHMEHLPVNEEHQVKTLMTTGTISYPNYSNTKLGKRTEFNHSFGAVIVEVSDTHSLMRQFSIDDNGVICDLDVTVNGREVTVGNNTEAIVYGDIHQLFMADVVKDKGFFDDDSLLHTLKPKQVVLHDLLDTMTVSHHHKNKPFTKYAIKQSGTTIFDEIESVNKFLSQLISENVLPVVVSSNHNSHLTYWLENVDWKSNLKYAKDILNMQLMMLKEIDNINDMDGKTPDVLNLLLKERFSDSVKVLEYKEQYAINSFRVDQHGHTGINGARSMVNLPSKITSKMIIGHAHTAARYDGLLTVGVSSKLDRNYTYGMSSWSHTHAIVHTNNKAQLVTQDSKDGTYRLPQSNSKGSYLKEVIVDTQSTLDFKYKVLDSDNNVVGYFNGYRGIGNEIFNSVWKGRMLVENGSAYGYKLVVL